MPTIPRDLRIGIIGGGASGLATAHTLREHGFANVVVLESESEPGGKCCTFWHHGRAFELGAAVMTPAYRETWRLAKRFGVTPRRRLGASYVDADTGRVHVHPYLPPTLRLRDALGLPAQMLRILSGGLLKQMRQFPRLDLAPESLAEPFESWCTRRRLHGILELMRPWMTSFGYGHMDDVPALYMLNYMCLLGPTYELPEIGYRGLWKRVAYGLDVHCDSRVVRVRRGQTISVETTQRSYEFDRLVIASPLECALEFLDATQEERELFSQVRYIDYQVIAAEVAGMPKDTYVFMPKNFGRDAHDKPMFYYRRYSDHNLITFYSFRGQGGLDAAEREVAALVGKMGGQLDQTVTRHVWRYFPHVSSDSIREGFHRKVEALQGVRKTFYASEVLSFSCVEPVVAFARELVQRHFVHAFELQDSWLERGIPANSQEKDLAQTG